MELFYRIYLGDMYGRVRGAKNAERTLYPSAIITGAAALALASSGYKYAPYAGAVLAVLAALLALTAAILSVCRLAVPESLVEKRREELKTSVVYWKERNALEKVYFAYRSNVRGRGKFCAAYSALMVLSVLFGGLTLWTVWGLALIYPALVYIILGISSVVLAAMTDVSEAKQYAAVRSSAASEFDFLIDRYGICTAEEKDPYSFLRDKSARIGYAKICRAEKAALTVTGVFALASVAAMYIMDNASGFAAGAALLIVCAAALACTFTVSYLRKTATLSSSADSGEGEQNSRLVFFKKNFLTAVSATAIFAALWLGLGMLGAFILKKSFYTSFAAAAVVASIVGLFIYFAVRIFLKGKPAKEGTAAEETENAAN